MIETFGFYINLVIGTLASILAILSYRLARRGIRVQEESLEREYAESLDISGLISVQKDAMLSGKYLAQFDGSGRVYKVPNYDGVEIPVVLQMSLTNISKLPLSVREVSYLHFEASGLRAIDEKWERAEKRISTHHLLPASINPSETLVIRDSLSIEFPWPLEAKDLSGGPLNFENMTIGNALRLMLINGAVRGDTSHDPNGFDRAIESGQKTFSEYGGFLQVTIGTAKGTRFQSEYIYAEDQFQNLKFVSKTQLTSDRLIEHLKTKFAPYPYLTQMLYTEDVPRDFDRMLHDLRAFGVTQSTQLDKILPNKYLKRAERDLYRTHVGAIIEVAMAYEDLERLLEISKDIKGQMPENVFDILVEKYGRPKLESLGVECGPSL